MCKYRTSSGLLQLLVFLDSWTWDKIAKALMTKRAKSLRLGELNI